VILNDRALALIKVKQERRQYAYSGIDLPLADAHFPAHYFGVPLRVARSAAEFRAAFAEALRAQGPTVIEALVEPELYSTILYG